MSLCGDVICQPEANKIVWSYQIGNTKATPKKGDWGKKELCHLTVFLILFEAILIENKMHRIHRGRIPNLFPLELAMKRNGQK